MLKNRLAHIVVVLGTLCAFYLITKLEMFSHLHLYLGLFAMLLYSAVGPRVIHVFPNHESDVSPYSPCHIGYFEIKRLIDILLSVVFLLIGMPLFVFISIAIRLGGSSSVIYRRKAIGRNGKIFDMLKFRSTVADSDQILLQNIELGEIIRVHHTTEENPEISRVGTWLRAYSLDELPQLVNVLAGNMSLVGPRPIHPDEAREYGHAIELYMAVTPGITGLWQISRRWELSFADRVKLDAKYMHERGLSTDIKLLVKTFSAVVRRNGAY